METDPYEEPVVVDNFYKNIIEGAAGLFSVTTGAMLYTRNPEMFNSVQAYTQELTEMVGSTVSQPGAIESATYVSSHPEFTAPLLVAGGFAAILDGGRRLDANIKDALEEQEETSRS